MIDFQAVKNARPAAGLVLRVDRPSGYGYMRLTHVWEGKCVYYMWIGEPEEVRNARRPYRMSWIEFTKRVLEYGSLLGRVALPPALAQLPAEGSDEDALLKSAWMLIEPLIRRFDKEPNLSRRKFQSLIRNHAEATQTNFLTLRRLVLRHYYFGGDRAALLPLPRGGNPGQADTQLTQGKPRKRRGRPGILAADEKNFKKNDFVVRPVDIDDMLKCYRKCLNAGPTSIPEAHRQYLANEFKTRHPDLFAEYAKGVEKLNADEQKRGKKKQGKKRRSASNPFPKSNFGPM